MGRGSQRWVLFSSYHGVPPGHSLTLSAGSSTVTSVTAWVPSGLRFRTRSLGRDPFTSFQLSGPRARSLPGTPGSLVPEARQALSVFPSWLACLMCTQVGYTSLGHAPPPPACPELWPVRTGPELRFAWPCGLLVHPLPLAPALHGPVLGLCPSWCPSTRLLFPELSKHRPRGWPQGSSPRAVIVTTGFSFPSFGRW